MFPRSSPARDIDELASALRADHRPGHIYRGQTAFYEPTVPSAFRPFVKAAEPDGWVKLGGISDAPTAPGVSYEAERYEIKDSLARSFNRGLTNLLAQQYGLSSDMFDVTGSISVAATFATRSWPTYQPYVPKQSGEVGVIYRAHCSAPPPSLRQFEELTEHLYLETETGQRGFFENVHPLSLEAKSLVGQVGLRGLVGHQFPEGLRVAPLFKMPLYCPPGMMRNFVIERLNELGFGDLVGPGKPFASTEQAYESSRIARQAGGVVSPGLRYQGVVPASIELVPQPGNPDRLRVQRDFAVSGGLVYVFNLNSDPNFERFFFLHDPAKAIAVTHLDDLWPPRDIDPIFDVMCGAVEGFFAMKRGVPKFDPLLVLDRGYSTDAGG